MAVDRISYSKPQNYRINLRCRNRYDKNKGWCRGTMVATLNNKHMVELKTGRKSLKLTKNPKDNRSQIKLPFIFVAKITRKHSLLLRVCDKQDSTSLALIAVDGLRKIHQTKDG